jgi:hypothetical protein
VRLLFQGRRSVVADILSIAGPMTSGVPSKVADVGVSCTKSRKRTSSGGWPLAVIDSHFRSFRNNPRSAPSAFIMATSEATMAAGPPRVTSSMKAIFRGLLHAVMRGWMARQNSRGPRGSPCWQPSCDKIVLLENFSNVVFSYDERQNWYILGTCSATADNISSR